MSLKLKVAERITEGLSRKTLAIPSIWAEKCRVMGPPFEGPYDFKWTPWCKEMIDTEHEDCVGQKSAQAGFTEMLLNLGLYTIDQQKRSVLYLLPNTKPDASDFSQSRFNPALELSDHLASMFSSSDNIGLKTCGSASLYIRGSRSRAQLKSIPVSKVLADEVDEMDQEALVLAYERMSGQLEKQFWKISTPSVPGFGINYHFEKSTKEHFMFKCPHCSRTTELLFPDCLVITAEDERDPNVRQSYIRCKECHKELTREEKHIALLDGEWHATEPNRNIRGFWVNQMYSYTVRPHELALAHLRGLTSQEAEQEFYNSKLGQTHIVDGAKLVAADVEKCIGQHTNPTRATGLITIGVDVGKALHYRIHLHKPIKDPNSNDINDRTHVKMLAHGAIYGWTEGMKELDPLIQAYRPMAVVIDAQPETTAVNAVCKRYKGLAFKCYYSTGAKAKDIVINENESKVSVNRTTWMDTTLNRFRRGTITIPINTDKEFIDHQVAPIRVYRKDNMNHDVSMYVNKDADHYAHAGVYAEIALKVAETRSSMSTLVESPLA